MNSEPSEAANRDYALRDRPNTPLTPIGRILEEQVGYALIDRNLQTLLAIDARTQMLLEVDAQQLEQVSLPQLFPEIEPELWHHLRNQLDIGDVPIHTPLRTARANTKDVWLRFRTLLGSSAQVESVLLSIQLCSALLVDPSHRDALTNLPDRRALAQRFTALQKNSVDESPQAVILFLDLDNFKAVNDEHGHSIGDRVLVELARRWQTCVRDDDLIVRYGGDEFIVLLPAIENSAAAEAVENRLKSATAKPIQVDQLQLQLTATIGIAIAKDKATGLEQLIDLADRTMYAAKQKPE